MFAKTKLTYPVGYAKQITLPWDSDCLANSYGVCASEGKVYSRYCVQQSDYYQDEEVVMQGMWAFDGGILQWTDEGMLVIRSPQMFDVISDDKYSFVELVQTNDGLLILTDLGVLLYQTGNQRATKLNCLPFVKATLHKNRCFAITGLDDKLYFSQFDSHVNFDGDDAGWLAFDERGGKCLSLCQIDNCLYVFRQHSVERVTATADTASFAVKSIAFSCGRLYGNTLSSNGHRAIFLTDWGLWSFDGKLFSRVAKHLDYSFASNNDYAMAQDCSLGYVLNARLNFDSGKLLCEKGNYTNNCLVVVASSGVVVLRGWDFYHMSTVDGQLLAVNNGVVYTVSTQQLATPRQCQLQTDFNSHKGKTVQFVTLTTKYPLTMTVCFNNTSKVFDLPASNLPQSVYVNATGKNFKFVFQTEGEMCIDAIGVDYLLYKGGVAP